MITIFDYTDFKILSDYHEELKKETPDSLTDFFAHRGINPDFTRILKGKKPHSPIGNQTRPCA